MLWPILIRRRARREMAATIFGEESIKILSLSA